MNLLQSLVLDSVHNLFAPIPIELNRKGGKKASKKWDLFVLDGQDYRVTRRWFLWKPGAGLPPRVPLSFCCEILELPPDGLLAPEKGSTDHLAVVPLAERIRLGAQGHIRRFFTEHGPEATIERFRLKRATDKRSVLDAYRGALSLAPYQRRFASYEGIEKHLRKIAKTSRK